MKVMLLQDIKSVGKKYDIKDLSDGYVRNFLLPNKMVKIAAASDLKESEKQKAVLRKKEEDLIRGLKATAEKLKDAILEFPVKVGDKEEVFGSVGEKQIEKALEEKGFAGISIKLDKRLKTLGEHEVRIDLGRGAETKIKVVLKAEE